MLNKITKQECLHTLIGLFCALVLCNQSIRTLLQVNLISVYFLILLGLCAALWLQDANKFILNKKDLPLFILGASTFIYALLSLFQVGVSDLSLLRDLLILFIFFFIGRCFSLSSLKCMMIVIIMIGSIHSLMLIINREYVYSAGVNYLLMSLSVGLATCLSYISIYKSSGHKIKILSFICFLLGWLGLFSMQSRAIFIFAAFYTLFFPLLLMGLRKKIIYISGLLVSILLTALCFWSYLIKFYENSKIHQRMTDLIFNFENEPRFITYGTYFSKFDDFYLTGYGIGGTTPNIYSYTIEKYPHNLILEFWSEFGLIGLMFSFLLVMMGVFSCFPYRNTGLYGGVVITLFIFYLMNFMKSFSIYDSAAFFLVVGVITNVSLKHDIDKKFGAMK